MNCCGFLIFVGFGFKNKFHSLVLGFAFGAIVGGYWPAFATAFGGQHFPIYFKFCYQNIFYRFCSFFVDFISTEFLF
jgi:hypothetical protein